jgi:hypothetical protein
LRRFDDDDSSRDQGVEILHEESINGVCEVAYVEIQATQTGADCLLFITGCPGFLPEKLANLVSLYGCEFCSTFHDFSVE